MRTPLFIPLDPSKLKGRVLGPCRAHQLKDGQEFRSLATGREGYVLGHERRRRHNKITGAVRVLISGTDPLNLDEKNLHPRVMVEGL